MGATIGVLLNCGQQSQFSKIRREFDAGRVNLDPPMTCADWPVPGNLTLFHTQTAYTRKPWHRIPNPVVRKKNLPTSQYINFCPRHWCQSSRCAAPTEIHCPSPHGCWKDRTRHFSYSFWRSFYASSFGFLFLVSLSPVFVRFPPHLKPNLLRLILMEVVARWSYW